MSSSGRLKKLGVWPIKINYPKSNSNMVKKAKNSKFHHGKICPALLKDGKLILRLSQEAETLFIILDSGTVSALKTFI